MSPQEMAKWEKARTSGKKNFAAKRALIFTAVYVGGSILYRQFMFGRPWDWSYYFFITAFGSILTYFVSLSRWEKCESEYLSSQVPNRELGA